MRVIDHDQTQLGVIPLKEALERASETGHDLVEVSTTERPPVCRIMDYGKFKYERKKRQKQATGGHVIQLKEIRLRPKTDDHDREIKLARATEFLEEGHKVQFTMLFRGRERFHRDRAAAIFDRILEGYGETVKVERRPVVEGRRMTMVIAPSKGTAHATAPTPAKTSPPAASTPPRRLEPRPDPDAQADAPSRPDPAPEGAPPTA